MQHIDELIREYLLFRGFTNALKWFDFDVKLDKDKGFRVSKFYILKYIILIYIYVYDILIQMSNFNWKLISFIQVDKLVDQILQLVYSYDLSTIRELWSHFENKLFSKLDQDISYGLLYI